MRTRHLLYILMGLTTRFMVSQTNPIYGREIPVTITGHTLDAMEAFISPDGNTLFFNSLNSGGNTNLHYANKVNDSTFTSAGLLGGTYDPSLNHLDGVASLDTAKNFYWVSLRAFPNLHKGKYAAGNVTNITKTYGDFNILQPGWIIMDAAISYQGDLLYYCNAFFGPTFSECPGVPCKARLGVAQKTNDSTFTKLSNTDAIFSKVNDTNYVVYAPQVTKNGLELQYTRILKATVNSELCLSTRTSVADTFGLPVVIYSNNGFVPEAASPTTDNLKIYYHQKTSGGLHKLFLRNKIDYTVITEKKTDRGFKCFPNPTTGSFRVEISQPNDKINILVYSLLGQEISRCQGCTSIDITGCPKGLYIVIVQTDNKILTTKLVKE